MNQIVIDHVSLLNDSIKAMGGFGVTNFVDEKAMMIKMIIAYHEEIRVQTIKAGTLKRTREGDEN